MERLPESEQRFVVEFIKKVSKSNNFSDTEEVCLEELHQRQKKAVRKFIAALDSIEPLADDPIDEILTRGITLRSPEELDLL